MNASTEEDVRIRVSACIEEKILKPLGMQPSAGKYEYALISGARVDALYGHVIVEYKAPGKLSSALDIQKTKEQVAKYIMEEAGEEVRWGKYLGIIISDRIAFIKYEPHTREWLVRGPYDLRRESVVKLIEAIRGLQRRRLDVEGLIEGFGPRSPLAARTVSLLYEKLKTRKKARTEILFKDWMRLFKQATGYMPEGMGELPKLADEYGLPADADYDAFMFSIQTYYALIMKLLAAEIAYIYGGGKFYRSYIAEADDAYSKQGSEGLRRALKDLEGGGIFRNLLNIENFLEGDYFSWYLEEMDEGLAKMIAEIARSLASYEIATPQLEPEFARDLLKRLYQNLIPGEIRHRLGEFYTPDWLAEILLDDIGLSMDDLLRAGKNDPLAPLNIRILDPACGSGTFLLLHINRLRRYAEEHFLTDQILNYVLNNVVGYDLNPLAVLAARTNYLLAIADLLGYTRGKIELPVYLADSIIIEQRTQLMESVYVLRTAVGEFQLPRSTIDGGRLPEILSEISHALKNKYTVDEFKERSAYAFESEADLEVIVRLYRSLLKLELEGKNHVWVAILRNSFAPILKGKFDYVVGNPPWINWESLPEGYRDASRNLWLLYGLAEVKGKVGLGKVKRDMAMLFLARCFDSYLKAGGKLGFLVPFTSFKTFAGAGFRTFLANKTAISVVHDLVTLYPFEGAVNRTAAIVVEKPCNLRESNEHPDIRKRNVEGIRHVIWVNLSGRPIPTDASLDEVLSMTERHELLILPIASNDPGSPWMQATGRVAEVARRLMSAPQHYEAHAGVYAALNQVYYVRIKDRLPDGRLVITNPPEAGQKKEVRQVEVAVEPDLVYPLVRGRDVKRWYVDIKEQYIILPHNIRTGKPIPEIDVKVRAPHAYDYFNIYREELKERSIHRLWGKDLPFYSVYDIGSYTFAPYKVIWKNIAGAITGKAEFSCAVIGDFEDRLLGKKTVIPNVKLMLVPLQSEDEAHYLAGVLNSAVVRTIVASYVIETGISTHILDHVRVPKYDPNNATHREISQLSKRAHELARRIFGEGAQDLKKDLKATEERIEILTASLFGINAEELRAFTSLLKILSHPFPDKRRGSPTQN